MLKWTEKQGFKMVPISKNNLSAYNTNEYIEQTADDGITNIIPGFPDVPPLIPLEELAPPAILPNREAYNNRQTK